MPQNGPTDPKRKLAWSRHQYAELVRDQKVLTWIGCHRRAFTFFGGIPARVVIDNPKAAMYIWAKIPEAYAEMGSLEFAKKLLADAKLAAAPGIGFGQYGDTHVRLALIENEARIRQAVRGIKDMFRRDGLLASAGVGKKDSARAA